MPGLPARGGAAVSAQREGGELDQRQGDDQRKEAEQDAFAQKVDGVVIRPERDGEDGREVADERDVAPADKVAHGGREEVPLDVLPISALADLAGRLVLCVAVEPRLPDEPHEHDTRDRDRVDEVEEEDRRSRVLVQTVQTRSHKVGPGAARDPAESRLQHRDDGHRLAAPVEPAAVAADAAAQQSALCHAVAGCVGLLLHEGAVARFLRVARVARVALLAFTLLLCPLLGLKRDTEPREPHGHERENERQADRPEKPEAAPHLVELLGRQVYNDPLGERVVPQDHGHCRERLGQQPHERRQQQLELAQHLRGSDDEQLGAVAMRGGLKRSDGDGEREQHDVEDRLQEQYEARREQRDQHREEQLDPDALAAHPAKSVDELHDRISKRPPRAHASERREDAQSKRVPEHWPAVQEDSADTLRCGEHAEKADREERLLRPRRVLRARPRRLERAVEHRVQPPDVLAEQVVPRLGQHIDERAHHEGLDRGKRLDHRAAQLAWHRLGALGEQRLRSLKRVVEHGAGRVRLLRFAPRKAALGPAARAGRLRGLCRTIRRAPLGRR
eukprot:3942336-Prymnesium_polylepis.1